MSINSNIMALTAHRLYALNPAMYGSTAQKMQAQIRILNIAAQNYQQALQMLDNTEYHLHQAHNILQRMRELAILATGSNNIITVDTATLANKFANLLLKLDNIAQTAPNHHIPLPEGSETGAAATNIRSNCKNIADIGIIPGKSICFDTGFGFSGYGQSLVIINADSSYIAEYPIMPQDLTPGRHSVTFNDGTIFSYNIYGSSFANADALISALDISFDVERGFLLVINSTTLGLSQITLNDAGLAINRTEAALKVIDNRQANVAALKKSITGKLNGLHTMKENLQATSLPAMMPQDICSN